MGVQLPEFDKDDHIKNIECGWRASAIITEKGSVWITEIPAKKVQKEKEKEKEEEEEEKQGRSDKGKKKKKESVEIQEEKKVDKPHSKWLDLTPKCGSLK